MMNIEYNRKGQVKCFVDPKVHARVPLTLYDI